MEYELPHVTQIQVHAEDRADFAAGLRSVLRQDPDIIMVGEIRDPETLEMAVQAALTGHLVFSTLHCNDAAGAAARCIDMGLEPFLLTSSVIAIMAQRLVRQDLPALQGGGALLAGAGGAAGDRAGHYAVPRPGLRPVPEHRLPGPPGRLRADEADGGVKR